jgi:hypothetical protein
MGKNLWMKPRRQESFFALVIGGGIGTELHNIPQ